MAGAGQTSGPGGLGGGFHELLILEARQPSFLLTGTLCRVSQKTCPRQVVVKGFHVEINPNRQLEPARMPVVLCKSTKLEAEQPGL